MRVRGTGPAGFVLAVTMALAACSTPVDEAGARKAATDYYTAHPRESDGVLADIMILGMTPTTRGGHAGWDARVYGKVILPGLPDGYSSTLILFVDATNGQVTEVGAG
jgi:hypothetical protein